MPEFYTGIKTSLSNGFYARTYACKQTQFDDYAEQGIIKIFDKKNTLINAIKTDGGIEKICFIKNKEFLAIIIEGQGNEVLLYDPCTTRLVKKHVFSAFVEALSSTDEHWIVAVKGMLYILNNNTEHYKTIKAGSVVRTMAASGTYLFCDVAEENKGCQLKMYDCNKGTFIRDIGDLRPNNTTKIDEICILEDNKIAINMRLLSNKSHIHVYCSKTGKELNVIDMDYSTQIFLYSLPFRILICRKNKDNDAYTIDIYNPLKKKPILSFKNVDINLESQNIRFFIARKEQESVFPLIKHTTNILNKMGTFPTPITHLIADYSVPRYALENRETDEFLKKLS